MKYKFSVALLSFVFALCSFSAAKNRVTQTLHVTGEAQHYLTGVTYVGMIGNTEYRIHPVFSLCQVPRALETGADYQVRVKSHNLLGISFVCGKNQGKTCESSYLIE